LNLHSLEFALRAVLFKETNSVQHFDAKNLRVGDTYPINFFTNYMQLRELIENYNELPSTNLPISDEPIKLRDALAHGRVSSQLPDMKLEIVKFRPERNGQVRVVFYEKITEEWLKKQVSMLNGEIKKISKDYSSILSLITN